ncbi:MAG TPA: hypothetical protein VF283_12595 [Bryobacteraceae bacterium]
MLPNELTAERFDAYPSEARALAVRELPLMRQLPLSYLPLLLREVIDYDWKFPAERKEIDDQFSYLGAMSRQQLAARMLAFVQIKMSPALGKIDWVNDPIRFSEELSKHLWETHQMDHFRQASIAFIHGLHVARPAKPLPLARLAMVIIGEDVQTTNYPLFRKLRRQGTHFTNVLPANGRKALFQALQERASAHPIPYAHWHIDGGNVRTSRADIAAVSYEALLPVRDKLLSKMVNIMSGGSGPELLRTKLALMRPGEFGLPDQGDAQILSRFQLSLLTEGSGTQIFSTTFVMWAAREALRRAQPLTVLAHYTPRQRDAIIQAPTGKPPVTDPQSSLIDADIGAYYTWIDQQRLSGAAQSGFLAWFEAHKQAVAIGPKWKPGTTESGSVGLADVVKELA